MLPPMSGLNLSAGEQVIFEGHPSWRAILGFYLKGLLIAVVAGAIAKVVGAATATVFLIVLVILALTLLIGFVKRVTTTYTITNRRLNIKRGLISREVQETRLERVQNVNYNQSLYQRVMLRDPCHPRRRRLRHRRHRRLRLHVHRRRRSGGGRAAGRPGDRRRRRRRPRARRGAAPG